MPEELTVNIYSICGGHRASVVSSIAITWVDVDSSKQASLTGSPAIHTSNTKMEAGSISVLTDSRNPTSYAALGILLSLQQSLPRASEKGAGSRAKHAVSTVALSTGSHSSSTAALCCGASHCWRTVPLAGLSASSGKHLLGPVLIPKSRFLYLHKAAWGKLEVHWGRIWLPATSCAVGVMLWDTAYPCLEADNPGLQSELV